MRAVRDLRDLVNVSRLSYVDSDDDDSNYNAPSMYSFRMNSSMNFEQSTYFGNNDPQSKINKKIQLNYHNNSPKGSFKGVSSPVFSSTTPMQSSSNFGSSSALNQSETRSSFFKDKSSLFDRNSKPSVNNILSQSQVSLNFKKPLPPLKQREQSDHKSEFEIQPLTMSKTTPDTKKNPEPNDETESANDAKNNSKNGNFDHMLTYIDASVVGEWLNRANRSLRKMHRWHQDNSSLYKSKQPDKLLKYESFVNFANFWLGCNKISKLDHKQRRQLLEMEYSIICDEVTQAFQIGIESQEIGIADIHRLLHAVFKEYPLQLLSFRGVYMLLDYVDILGSNRLDEYKNLLSDVKCRTVNKQYAQWLLSIRSFSLINLCWSIVKFYKNTCEEEVKKNVEKTPLEELDCRISSLSVARIEKSRSESTSSTISSSSTESNFMRPKSTKNNFIHKPEVDFIPVSKQEKFDFYLEAVLKNDYPEVLHYLITTKKCDPLQIDEKGRTLIFLAVINDLPKILNYLVRRCPSIDINAQCHSGNTALHAAVNQGNLVLVELLLNTFITDDTNDKPTDSFLAKSTKRLDVNIANQKCMNATPLHLAVWNDFNEIAIRLVQSKADPYLKMNSSSNAFDLALENSNQVLYELISEYLES